MAELIGVASGVAGLATFALTSSITLYETVKSYRSHPQRVRELSEELEALSDVLRSLTETVGPLFEEKYPALKLPLLRCGKACQEFQEEVIKCSSRSHDRTSFRDWAKLRYMGEDIDGFRRLLAGYKTTINIALTDAHLRRSIATSENIQAYQDLVTTAQADLEDHLERINEKLDTMLVERAGDGTTDGMELKTIKEERLSTEKCLQICAQLSSRIEEIQLHARDETAQSGPNSLEETPGKIICDGLEECKASLAQTVLRLRGHETQLFERMMQKIGASSITQNDRIDLARLRDEWEATRENMIVCAQAHDQLKDNASTIDNYATGDAVQFMVSTGDKTLHGKNRGMGWRTRQYGGHMSDESLRDLVRTVSSVHMPSRYDEANASSGEASEIEKVTKFTGQYGKGVSLTAKSTVKDDSRPHGS